MKTRLVFLAAVLIAALLSAVASGAPQSTDTPAIAELRGEVADLKKMVEILKNDLRFATSPHQEGRWVRWDPKDEQSVARMKLALGRNYFNHGGLLRTHLNGELVEIPPGTDVLFEPPKWTPIRTWPELQRR